MNIYDCLYSAMLMSGYDRSEARAEAIYRVKTETYCTVIVKKPCKKVN